MNPFAEQTSAEVAEEAEQERAGLVSTLDQLRQNLRPGNMVDEMFSQAQANSSDVMDRIWGLVRANPIPSTLIGIGAAMLLNGGRKLRNTRESANSWNVYDANADVDSVDLASEARPSERDWQGSHHEHLGDTMGYASYRRPVTGLTRLFDEQPLILAAIGVVVGAAVGSALPLSDVESQLMGDTSESVRRNASAMAQDQISQLRTTASDTLDQLKSTAAAHGVSAENVSGLMHDLGDDVRTAAATATRSTSGSPTH